MQENGEAMKGGMGRGEWGMQEGGSGEEKKGEASNAGIRYSSHLALILEGGYPGSNPTWTQ